MRNKKNNKLKQGTRNKKQATTIELNRRQEARNNNNIKQETRNKKQEPTIT